LATSIAASRSPFCIGLIDQRGDGLEFLLDGVGTGEITDAAIACKIAGLDQVGQPVLSSVPPRVSAVCSRSFASAVVASPAALVMR
jgi:hypothetical protein